VGRPPVIAADCDRYHGRHGGFARRFGIRCARGNGASDELDRLLRLAGGGRLERLVAWDREFPGNDRATGGDVAAGDDGTLVEAGDAL